MLKTVTPLSRFCVNLFDVLKLTHVKAIKLLTVVRPACRQGATESLAH